jgi:hypothetical protein
MNGKFSENMGTLKKNQTNLGNEKLNMSNKNSVENFNRVDQAEGKILGLEDEVMN